MTPAELIDSLPEKERRQVARAALKSVCEQEARRLAAELIEPLVKDEIARLVREVVENINHGRRVTETTRSRIEVRIRDRIEQAVAEIPIVVRTLDVQIEGDA